jgi:hypothetical protein
MTLLYFDDLLVLFFIFFIWHFLLKNILSTNGTAFLGSLNGKKMPKQRERKMMPPPQLCTRGQEEIIDHGISHKSKKMHYHNTLAISTQIILFLKMLNIQVFVYLQRSKLCEGKI